MRGYCESSQYTLKQTLLNMPFTYHTASIPVTYLVILKHGQLDLLLLVLILLGCGVVLLLALLGATTQPQH